MIGILWPLVVLTTVVLYGLIIITYPFNPVLSTIFLFALIAYWSRLPGVGVPHPFYILYQSDLVDLFSMIIAINIGGPQGALFTIFGNMWSRTAGTYPVWANVINDAASQAIICLFIPYIHALTGDIFMSMMIYTIFRRLGFVIGWFIYPRFSLPQMIVINIGATIASFLINGFYAKIMGNFLDNLLKSGVTFNWTLFAIVTAIMGLFYYLTRKTFKAKTIQKNAMKKILRKVLGIKVKKKSKARNVQISDEELVQHIKEGK